MRFLYIQLKDEIRSSTKKSVESRELRTKFGRFPTLKGCGEEGEQAKGLRSSCQGSRSKPEEQCPLGVKDWL